MGEQIDFWSRASVSERSIIEDLRLELIENQRMMSEADDVIDLDALWEARRSIVNQIHKIQEEQGEKDVEERKAKEKIKFAKAWLDRHFETHTEALEALKRYEDQVDLFTERFGYHPEV